MISASNWREDNVMNGPKGASIAVDAFFDNFTCAALFRKLRIPGESRRQVNPQMLDEIWMAFGNGF